jgi:hypothetical protein
VLAMVDTQYGCFVCYSAHIFRLDLRDDGIRMWNLNVEYPDVNRQQLPSRFYKFEHDTPTKTA